MASHVLTIERPTTGKGFWPAFFRRQVAANVRFWLGRINAHRAPAPLLHRERDNIVKALSRALQLEPAWELATDLLLTFHPYVERQGIWADWERFLEIGLEISQRQGNVTHEAALLDRLGELKRYQGDLTAAVACHKDAHRLGNRIEDVTRCAYALTNLGHAYRLQRKYVEASRVLKKALGGYQASQRG